MRGRDITRVALREKEERIRELEGRVQVLGGGEGDEGVCCEGVEGGFYEGAL